MADTAYIEIPAITGTLAAQEFQPRPIARVTVPSTIAHVVASLLTPATSGGPNAVLIRLGTTVTSGVEGVDYGMLVFSQGVAVADVAWTIPVAAGAMLYMMVQNGSAPSAGFYGSMRVEEVGPELDSDLYTTLARVKSAIGIASSDTTQDATIDEIIANVSRLFDTLAEEPFSSRNVVEYHDGWSVRNGVTLNHVPSELVTDRDMLAIEENGTALVNGTDFMVEEYPSQMVYRTDSNGGFLQTFTNGYRNLKVSYKTRWVTVPGDIQLACRDESVRAFQAINSSNVDGNRIGITQRSNEVGTTLSFDAYDVLPATRRTLEAYRVARFA